MKIVDSPAEQLYYGACPAEGCGHALYVSAEEAGSYLQCPRCKAQHSVAHLQRQLASRVRDHLATCKEASRLMRTLGKPVSEQAIRRLVDKGLITPHGKQQSYDSLGRLRSAALYRIGDVLDAVGVERSVHVVR
jgi:hypothetical protein